MKELNIKNFLDKNPRLKEDAIKFLNDRDNLKFTNVELNLYIWNILKDYYKRVKYDYNKIRSRINNEDIRNKNEYSLFLSIYRNTPLYKKIL